MRGEARINVAAVVLRPNCCGPGSRMPRSRDCAQQHRAWARTRHASSVFALCYNMNEGFQNTHPLLIAPLAFAARRANETRHVVPAVLSLQPVDGRGRAHRPPAHVDVLIQPAPPDDAPRVLIAYPPVGYSQDHNASVEIFIHVAGCVDITSVNEGTDDAVVLARRAVRNEQHHAIEQAASMACRSTRRFSANAP